jgi:hypothetical protein
MSKTKNRSIDNLRTRYRPTCNDITLERGLEVNAVGTSRDGDNIVNVSRAAAFKRYAYAGGSGAVARPYLHTAERKSRRPTCGNPIPPLISFVLDFTYTLTAGNSQQTRQITVDSSNMGSTQEVLARTNGAALNYATVENFFHTDAAGRTEMFTLADYTDAAQPATEAYVANPAYGYAHDAFFLLGVTGAQPAPATHRSYFSNSDPNHNNANTWQQAVIFNVPMFEYDANGGIVYA